MLVQVFSNAGIHAGLTHLLIQKPYKQKPQNTPPISNSSCWARVNMHTNIYPWKLPNQSVKLVLRIQRSEMWIWQPRQGTGRSLFILIKWKSVLVRNWQQERLVQSQMGLSQASKNIWAQLREAGFASVSTQINLGWLSDCFCGHKRSVGTKPCGTVFLPVTECQLNAAFGHNRGVVGRV